MLQWYRALVSTDDVMIIVLRDNGYRIVGIIIPIVVTVGCCCFCYRIRRRRSNNDCSFDNSCLCDDDCCFDTNPIPSYGDVSHGDHIVRDSDITPADRRVNMVMQTTFNQSSSSHPSINRPSIPDTPPYNNYPSIPDAPPYSSYPSIPDAPPYSSHPSIPDAPPKYSEVCQTAVNPPLETQM